MSDTPGAADILAELASQLDVARRCVGACETVDLAKRATLLRIARDVAHATERQNAPLAAYLIGRFVQTCLGVGMTEAAAIDRAAEVVRSLIGEAPG